MLAGYGSYYAYVPKGSAELSACVKVTVPDREAVRKMFYTCTYGRWFPDQYNRAGDWIWQVRDTRQVLTIMQDILPDLPQQMRREVLKHIDTIQLHLRGGKKKGRRTRRKKKPA
jgi:hypothetical protein